MSRRYAYHPGTGTYWDANDEWYVVEVEDAETMTDDQIEEYLDYIGMFAPENNPEVAQWHECPGCQMTFALAEPFTE